MTRSITLTICLLIAALYVQAQNFETCDRWNSWDVNGYTIYNNIWGDGHGTQCLWAYNEGSWGVWADHPNSGGIKSYPNVDYDVNYTVSSMPTITASFNATTPGWGSYNTAFDIWYNNYDYEIMLWVNWNGSMGPISYNYGCSGYPSTACPVATNVNVGGHTWNLYEGTNGSATVYSFLRTSDTNSGTVNITQISQWLASNGYFGWNTNLHEIQFGFEITNSSGGADFRVNSYNVNVGNSGGGGGGGGGGSYATMTSRSSSKCVDVSGSSTSNNANVQQWDCHGGDNQEFELENAGSGYYYIKARHSGKCLRAVNGNVVQYDCNTGWWTEMFERIDAGSGYYILKNRNTGTCLRVENSSGSNGASIVLASCNTGWWSQQFSFSGAGSRIADEDLEPELIKELTSDVLVYPNPSVDGDFMIEISDEWKDSKLAIFDQSGKELFTRQLEESETIQIQSTLKPGMYLVNISGNGTTINRKLVVK